MSSNWANEGKLLFAFKSKCKKKNKEETKEGIPIFSHKWIANFMAKRKENEAKEKQQ